MSFGELLLIALIGLLVIGPKRLPETVRFIALQMGRLRQAVTQTRKMVEDEFGMDEIRRQLHNEQIMRSLKSTREEIERAGKGLPPKSTSTEKAGEPEKTAESSAETQQPNPPGSQGSDTASSSEQPETEGSKEDDTTAPNQRQTP